MPMWSEVQDEIRQTQDPNNGSFNFDGVRRKYIEELSKHTGRNTILYGSGWVQKVGLQNSAMSIEDADMQGFMEVRKGLSSDNLDLILHSPGGNPDAAEAIVCYLRSHFQHIRVIVPHLAMSAATMIACSADEIVLGEHSFLGPTDPQLLLSTSLGHRMVPANAILGQFQRATTESNDPERKSIWSAMAPLYGPDLIEQSSNVVTKAKKLVGDWLEKYMFKDAVDAQKRADDISSWLAEQNEFGTHSRHIPRDEVEESGLKVIRLEEDKNLQDLVLSVYHAATIAFASTPCVKIIENSIGRAYIANHNLQQTMQVPPEIVQGMFQMQGQPK